MTANELAVDLELQSSQMEYGYAVSDWKLLSDSATMLRKQQSEIEKLKLRELTEDEIKEVYDQYFDLENLGGYICNVLGKYYRKQARNE